MPEEIVKVGSKPIENYREAFLYAINNFGVCIIKALGKRRDKAEKLIEYAEGFDGIEIEYKKIIEINDSKGKVNGIEAKAVIADE